MVGTLYESARVGFHLCSADPLAALEFLLLLNRRHVHQRIMPSESGVMLQQALAGCHAAAAFAQSNPIYSNPRGFHALVVSSIIPTYSSSTDSGWYIHILWWCGTN